MVAVVAVAGGASAAGAFSFPAKVANAVTGVRRCHASTSIRSTAAAVAPIGGANIYEVALTQNIGAP